MRKQFYTETYELCLGRCDIPLGLSRDMDFPDNLVPIAVKLQENRSELNSGDALICVIDSINRSELL